MLNKETLDAHGRLIGYERRTRESDKTYLRRINIVECTSRVTTLIDDISNIGAIVVRTENNHTMRDTETGLPPQSFRVTVVGGRRDDIARCIHDNRCPGVISVGNNEGIARYSHLEEYAERFDHIEIDYMMKAIEFMETWKEIIDKMEEKVTK